MIEVSRRARTRPDRGGDPLDGLVNLFDLGIVLALAFLLATLSSLELSELLTDDDVTVIRRSAGSETIIVKEGDRMRTVKLDGRRVVGQGRVIGSVYRLDDGRTVIVESP
jgi:hypothetical protein